MFLLKSCPKLEIVLICEITADGTGQSKMGKAASCNEPLSQGGSLIRHSLVSVKHGDAAIQNGCWSSRMFIVHCSHTGVKCCRKISRSLLKVEP